MMNIKYPINISKSGLDKKGYYRNCQLDMYTFRMILKQNINVSRLTALQKTLEENKIVEGSFKELPKNFTIIIVNQFINELRCTYNPTSECCYYYIPKTIRCAGTNVELLYIIKLIEFGNDKIPPLGWISHSYNKFKDYIAGRLSK